MDVERKRRGPINVSLSADDVYALQRGETVGTRLMFGSKVEISPLSAIEPDESGNDRYAIDRLTKALAAPLKGQIYPNGDVQVFVPEIKLSDVRVSSAGISRDEFEAPLSDEKSAKGLKKKLPQQGVIINFGGSLKVIDVLQLSYGR